MEAKQNYGGKPHPEQTLDLWRKTESGIHIRFRARPLGELLAIRVMVGATTNGPHRDTGQICLTPDELAELHRCFKGGCGMHGWRSDCEIFQE